MNIIESFAQANKGVDPKQIKQGSAQSLPNLPVPSYLPGAASPKYGTNPNTNTPPPVQPQHSTECTGDFDQVIFSIISQLKQLLNGYELDDEDHEKISSAIMKLDSLIPEGYVQVTQVSVQQTAPQQETIPQGMGMSGLDLMNQVNNTDTNQYLGSMM